jgi:hypothetical protein
MCLTRHTFHRPHGKIVSDHARFFLVQPGGRCRVQLLWGALTDIEQLTEALFSVAEEFINHRNVDEAMLSFRELDGPGVGHEIVRQIIVASLNHGLEGEELCGKLLESMFSSNTISRFSMVSRMYYSVLRPTASNHLTPVLILYSGARYSPMRGDCWYRWLEGRLPQAYRITIRCASDYCQRFLPRVPGVFPSALSLRLDQPMNTVNVFVGEHTQLLISAFSTRCKCFFRRVRFTPCRKIHNICIELGFAKTEGQSS